jgi:hypothetical protein
VPSPASFALRHLATLLAYAAAGFSLPGHAAAQAAAAAEAPAEQTFYEAIQVQTAEVEVVVTDRAGVRVTGLTRDDFALFENGERVEITSSPPTRRPSVRSLGSAWKPRRRESRRHPRPRRAPSSWCCSTTRA